LVIRLARWNFTVLVLMWCSAAISPLVRPRAAVMLFLFAYVDILGFFRSDIIEGALAGEVAGQGITINQAFLAGATGYIVFPSLMVVASLPLPAKLNRRLVIGVSVFYAVSITALCIGESWIYYLLGSFFEVVLLLIATRTCLTSP